MRRINYYFIVSALVWCGCAGKQPAANEEQFIGVWELQGRAMFEGVRIGIEKKEGKLSGRVLQLNGNKYIKLFVDSGAVWVSGIKRVSDFEFKLTEKKVAGELFSAYGLSSSQEFKARFIDENTIGLAAESGDPQRSSVVYRRVP